MDSAAGRAAAAAEPGSMGVTDEARMSQPNRDLVLSRRSGRIRSVHSRLGKGLAMVGKKALTTRFTVTVVLVTVVTMGCGDGTKQDSVTRTRRSTSTSTTSRASTTTRAPSAADDLAAYFAAAETTDQALAAAARKINAGVGADRLSFDQATVDAVAAADPNPTAKLIPTGLDPALLRAVLLVQSELTARFFAMRRVRVGTFPKNEFEAKDVLMCLGLGANPAAKFEADLAAAEGLAASLPPATPAAADSLPASELAIRLADILLRNSGCDSCGGAVITELAPIRWGQQPPPAPGVPPWDGDIGGIPFRAGFTAEAGWRIELNAC